MTPADPIANHFRLVEAQKRALKKLGLATLRDLLYHAPSRYERVGQTKSVGELAKGDEVSIYGTLAKLEARKAWKSKRPIAEAQLHDGTGKIRVMWFNQPYIAKMVAEGVPVKLTGTIGGTSGKLYLANPEIEPADEVPAVGGGPLFEEGDDATALFSIYPESRGITSKWFRHALVKLLASGMLEQLEDPVPAAILARYHLPTLQTALIWLHTPKCPRDYHAARKRFAFDEVFTIQIAKLKARAAHDAQKSLPIMIDKKAIDAFVARFAFPLTHAQQRAIDDILRDFAAPQAMSRLLEGDVGSGKTAVAAATAYAVATTHPEGQDFGNLQVAYMCPTEVLAKQQFESFIEYFSHLPIPIGLITASGCRKFPSKVNAEESTHISRTQLLKWVANGELPILVGTHALIQKSVQFENLAYVIIDEQHRFGTMQRHELVRKDAVRPHLLSMTATPIPRTLALTVYGDLDLTLLDEMPKGRKPIQTAIVKPGERDGVYAKVREELAAGRQAYVICPRIDEPDPDKLLALQATSAKEEARRLQRDVFSDCTVGLVHSKLTPKEKDEVMQRFAAGDIDVLVATSVVEVGVNVPNATVIIIEGAERFGLAQLHQLRGRVLRSEHQAYCYCFTNAKSRMSMERLKALQTAKNGFALAEHDLKLRGAGELYGRSQSGLSDLGMEALKNLKMVEAARKEAQDLLRTDPGLQQHPALKELIAQKSARLHFE